MSFLFYVITHYFNIAISIEVVYIFYHMFFIPKHGKWLLLTFRSEDDGLEYSGCDSDIGTTYEESSDDDILALAPQWF